MILTLLNFISKGANMIEDETPNTHGRLIQMGDVAGPIIVRMVKFMRIAPEMKIYRNTG